VRQISAFAAFWWDFIVGDDWRVAAGIGIALGLSALVAHRGLPAWWVLPAAVALVLAGSILRAVRSRS
jgi:uncharacterized membrane protein